MTFSYKHLSHLYDLADGPHVNFDEMVSKNTDVGDYTDLFVDFVPRNMKEARETLRLASEFMPVEIGPIKRSIERQGRTIEALIALRRLEVEARDFVDGCVPPLRYEVRVLRSLIAWMSRPVSVD